MALKKLIFSSALSQVIAVLTTIVVVRLYDKVDYGLAINLVSYANILTIIITLRFELLIVSQKTIGRSLDYSILSIVLSLFFSFLIVALSIFIYFIFQYKIDIVILVVVLACMFSFYRVFSNFMNACADYDSLAKGVVYNSAFSLFSKCALSISSLGVVYGALMAQSMTVFYFYRKSNVDLQLSSRKIKDDFVSNVKFIINQLPADMLNVVSIQASVILTGYYYSMKEVAALGLALSICALPLNVIGTSVSRIYRKELSDIFHDNKESAASHFESTFLKYFFIMLPLFLTLYFFAPIVITFLFGEKYSDSGVLIKYLVPLLFFQFLARVFTYVLIITEKFRLNLYMQIFLFLWVPFSFYFFKGDFYNSILLYSFGYMFFYIVSLILSWRSIKY